MRPVLAPRGDGQRLGAKDRARCGADPRYNPGVVVPLADLSDDTRALTIAALKGLRHIYRPGYSYKKCGVMLMELTAKAAARDPI